MQSPTPIEPSPAPSTTFDPTQQAAADTVMKWMQLWHQVEADHNAPVREFALMMTGDAQTKIMSRIIRYRENGHVGVGTVKVYIEGAEPVVEQEEGRSVYILACTDDEHDLIDTNTGESVLGLGYRPHVHWRINVVKSADGNRWIISDYTTDGAGACVRSGCCFRWF